MELTITNNREIKPYKVAVKQFESETTTLVFTRDSYMYGQVDLRQYTPYAVTSIGGAVDMTELSYDIVNGKLVITWVVQEYTLRQAGNITYQIVFKENASDGEGTGVFYTYEALLQCSESIDTDRPIAANYPTILKQWLDLLNNLAGTISTGIVYMGVGEAIPIENRLAGRLYYQIKNADTFDGHFEDNLGHKIGTFTGEYQGDADINKMISHGDYICAGTLLNAPIDCTYCMVRVTDTLSTNRVIQEVYVPDSDNTVRVFTRAITGYDTFGAWCELARMGTVNSNMVLVSDANGNVISHPHVSSTELNALNGYVVGAGSVETRISTLDTNLKTKAPLASPTFSGTPTAPTAARGTNTTQIATTAFVNDAVSTKQATVTGGASSITSTNLTASRALVSDSNGKVSVSAVTATELGHLDGVTSNVQTQLNAKAGFPDWNNYATLILQSNDSSYTPTVNGYLRIMMTTATGNGYHVKIGVQAVTGGCGGGAVTDLRTFDTDVMYPVAKGTTIKRISATGVSIYWLNAI